MKQIKINLFSIDELEACARERAIEENRYSLVEDSYWYESVFEDFTMFCSHIGITIPSDGIAFRGFYSQGDGSTFASDIDARQLLSGVRDQRWRDYAPNEDFGFEPCTCDGRVIELIRNGTIESRLSTEKPVNGYWIRYHSDHYWTTQEGRTHSNLDAQLIVFDKWVEEILDTLNRWLYRTLMREYEEWTSDTAIGDFLRVNSFQFTADGRAAERLLALAT